MTLTETQRWDIANALRVHADQSATDALAFPETPRVATSFREQCDRLRQLAELIENAEEIRVL